MDLKQLFAAIKKNELPPLLYLYSNDEEELLRQEAIDAILDALVPPGTRDFNFIHLYAEETDGAEIINNAALPPMMAEKRVVLVSNFGRLLESKQKALQAYMAKPSELTCLVLDTTMKKDPWPQKPKGKVFNYLKKNGWTVEFKRLYEDQLAGWAFRRIQKYKKEAQRPAVDLLVAQVGGNLRALDNEIQKIDIYTGAATTITVDDVEQVAGVSKHYTVFELGKQLGTRNLKAALVTLSQLLQQGTQPTAVLNAVLSQFTRIWKTRRLKLNGVPNQGIASQLRLNQFFINTEYVPQARLFTDEELSGIFENLQEADYNLKRSYMKPQTVLELLFYKICAPPHRPTSSPAPASG
jgi:DNA polymerase-3 subunit delta